MRWPTITSERLRSFAKGPFFWVARDLSYEDMCALTEAERVAEREKDLQSLNKLNRRIDIVFIGGLMITVMAFFFADYRVATVVLGILLGAAAGVTGSIDRAFENKHGAVDPGDEKSIREVK